MRRRRDGMTISVLLASAPIGTSRWPLLSDIIGYRRFPGCFAFIDVAFTYGKIALWPWEQVFHGELGGCRSKPATVKVIGG
jgi:hypothetical protein